MKIALVADALTRAALEPEARLLHLTPSNYRFQLRWHRPDFLLVESAWQGVEDAWKYQIAAYPDVPTRSNENLAQMVAFARDRGIPTVFWNKEDSVHFDRFIASARLFDHVFTVDENAIPRYRATLAPDVTVEALMFAVQPRIHYPTGQTPTQHRANFVGSYSHHLHDTRRLRQDMLFQAAAQSGLGLTVYDRNSERSAARYRYPDGMDVRAAVPYAATADLYRDYLASLNVNTIEDSPTMVSRRLVEIIGSGGLCVTTPSLAVETHFAPYCHVVAEPDEATELFARLHRDGRSAQDRAMLAEGAAFIGREHHWAARLEQIARRIGR